MKQGSAMGRQLDAAVYQPLLLPRMRQNLRATAATTFAVRWTFQQGPQTFLPTASTFPLAVQSKFLAQQKTSSAALLSLLPAVARRRSLPTNSRMRPVF